MPASSPEVSDDDSGPVPMSFHVSLTMEQAHFNAVMAEEEPASAPMSVFQQAREEEWYNLFLLEQHWLADHQVYG